ncbi:MAG: hypothetical protein ACLU3F_00540 [Blautia wexlerae]
MVVLDVARIKMEDGKITMTLLRRGESCYLGKRRTGCKIESVQIPYELFLSAPAIFSDGQLSVGEENPVGVGAETGCNGES